MIHIITTITMQKNMEAMETPKVIIDVEAVVEVVHLHAADQEEAAAAAAAVIVMDALTIVDHHPADRWGKTILRSFK